MHLKGFEALGVKIEQGHGYIEASAPEGMTGAIFISISECGRNRKYYDGGSNGKRYHGFGKPGRRTGNCRPCNYLNQMGARVRGAGTNVITIEGVSELHGVQHSVIPDRIEAGTYMIAAAMTGGDVIIENVLPEHQKPLIAKLREAGALVEEDIDRIHVVGSGKLKAVDIKTLPYPGFPTDMQAQMMAMLSVAKGAAKLPKLFLKTGLCMWLN